ncbi:unnamed protein product [Mortierella alpina]
MTEYWQWQLWHRESAFGEHEYDQERDVQAHASTMHCPVQYATAVAPSTLLMNQHYCPQALADARSHTPPWVSTTQAQARTHYRTLPQVKPVSSLDTTPPISSHHREALAPVKNDPTPTRHSSAFSSGATGESDEVMLTMDKRRCTRPMQPVDALTPLSECAVAARPSTPPLNQREGYRIRTFSPTSHLVAPASSSTSLPPTHSLDTTPQDFLNASALSSPGRYPVAMQRSCSESQPSAGEAPVSRPYSPSVLSSPIQTVRNASERGRLLAQRSKTSLNRLLNTVIDNAAALTAESISRHNLASGEKHCRPATPPTRFLRRPSPKPRQSSKAKFFVADEEDSDDEESEAEDFLVQPTIGRDPRHDNEDRLDHSQYKADDPLAGKNRSAPASHRLLPPPSIAPPTTAKDSPGTLRRQSLLSDLLMAEKLSAAQRLPASSTANHDLVGCPAGHPVSDSSSGYHSASNSDGESSHQGTYSKQHAYPSSLSAAQQSPQSNLRQPHQSREHPYSQQRYQRHDFPLVKASLGHGREPRPPLIRTRKSMFKNLDELAALTSTPTAEAEEDMVRSSMLSSSSSSASSSGFTAKSPSTVSSDHPLVDDPVAPSIARPNPSNALHQTHAHAVNSNGCCSHPTTATTTTCATASATSKTAHVSSAATMATAATGGNVPSGWARAHVPMQIHSVYGLLTSSVQRALSTVSTAS